jgi:glucose-6-phosphate 1-epimerase
MPKTHTLDELQGHYEIEGVVRFDAGEGGLTRAVITAPAGEAHVYLHGAHVTHFQPRGQRPVLFMSLGSRFELGEPIRGGVPVIFPWFGPRQGRPDSPMHGFVRLLEWGVESVEQNRDGSVTIVFDLASHDATRAHWPQEFELRYSVTIGQKLDMTLEVRNSSAEVFRFEEALHTYLAVGDVRQVRLEGLENTAYLDKVREMQRFEQGNEPLEFTGETDRVFLGTRAACIIHDVVNGRRIRIEKEQSDTTVVWNPWEAKARTMPDFGDDEWPRMLCVETCNAKEHAVELPPGRTHVMRAVIGVE